ncbi:hypothetical protein [uncultured Erythrobacter sp.]|uniref:hypothetical protein n=1 Tax=uncultured Erythrobacter sp. TaxID=263913 RepID=UPI00263893AC|nr:hypothetical protein [uncultured Erythrobacter sp.]
MRRSFSGQLLTATCVVAATLTTPLCEAFAESASAQEETAITDENRETVRMKTVFGQRVADMEAGCVVAEYFLLEKEFEQTKTNYDQRIALLTATIRGKSTAERRRRFKTIVDMGNAKTAIDKYHTRMKKACHPRYLSDALDADLKACDLDSAEAKLGKLRGIRRQLKLIGDQMRTVSKGGVGVANTAAIDVEAVSIWTVNAPPFFEGAEKAVRDYRAKQKSTPNGGDVCTDGEVIELDDVSGPPPEPAADPLGEDLCERVDGELLDPDYERDCNLLAPILGTWVNLELGGSIEFRLQADRTLSAFVGAANQRMEYYGYSNGMEILRGYRLAGVDGGTWLVWVNSGAEFSAKMPSREAGEQFGQAAWNQTRATIFIPKNDPNSIKLPGQLQWRLSDGKKWVRQR